MASTDSPYPTLDHGIHRGTAWARVEVPTEARVLYAHVQEITDRPEPRGGSFWRCVVQDSAGNVYLFTDDLASATPGDPTDALASFLSFATAAAERHGYVMRHGHSSDGPIFGASDEWCHQESMGLEIAAAELYAYRDEIDYPDA